MGNRRDGAGKRKEKSVAKSKRSARTSRSQTNTRTQRERRGVEGSYSGNYSGNVKRRNVRAGTGEPVGGRRKRRTREKKKERGKKERKTKTGTRKTGEVEAAERVGRFNVDIQMYRTIRWAASAQFTGGNLFD